MELEDATLTGETLRTALAEGNSVFRRCVLTGADARGVDLRTTTFDRCTADDAVLRGGDLDGMRVTGGSFAGASFVDADLTDAVFTDVDLSRARFGGALLADAHFTGCKRAPDSPLSSERGSAWLLRKAERSPRTGGTWAVRQRSERPRWPRAAGYGAVRRPLSSPARS